MSDLRSAMRVKADVTDGKLIIATTLEVSAAVVVATSELAHSVCQCSAATRLPARNRLHLRRDGERRTRPGKRVRMAAPTALAPTRIRVSVMSIGVMQAFGNQWPAKQARYAP